MKKQRMEEFFDRLWPLNRSITGDGLRESLKIINEIMPIDRLAFKTGSKVFDWTVPKEWIVRDAYFIDPFGKKHAEFKINNLHLMGYSIPFKGKVSLEELSSHLYSRSDLPEAIPYVTSYYEPNWGFCLSHKERQQLPNGQYQIFIDTELINGTLEIGETVLPGKTNEEILFSTYLCHPSMANNELSGPLVMMFLYEMIKAMPSRRYTYRFVISVETIGTICYLSIRGNHLKKNLVAGYVMTCLAMPGIFVYKESRMANSLADRAVKIILKNKDNHKILPFSPRGSDERQYCSQGFNLPVGTLSRHIGGYPQYHTSLDNKDLISFDTLEQAVDLYYSLVRILENNIIWDSTIKYCEPQLGKRNLYPQISTVNYKTQLKNLQMAILWILSYADGTNDLLKIAEISGCDIELLFEVVQILSSENLIKPMEK